MTLKSATPVIPKTLLQVSPAPIDSRVVDMSLRHCRGWTYEHFDDEKILKFFKTHPLDEYPDIQAQFESFTHGAHKADLFRYYYLYINGGVYLDSDAVIEAPIETIIDNNEFVTINGYNLNKQLIFNGFLICPPAHPIIKAALDDAYELNDSALTNDYHLICKNLYQIVEEQRKTLSSLHVYQEERDDNYLIGVRTYNAKRELLLTHYCYLRRVPIHADSWLRPIYPWIAKHKLLFKTYRALQKIC